MGSDGAALTEQRAMRCLHVASGDGWGGAEVSAFHLIVELAARPDVDVRCVTLNEGTLSAKLTAAGVPVDVIPERHGLREVTRRLDRIVREHQIELLHSHRYKEHLAAGWVARRQSIPHLRSAHGRAPSLRFEGRLHGVGPFLDRLLASIWGADWIAVSHDLAHEMTGLRQRVSVVRNGIPAASPPSDRATLEQPFGSPAWIVGFVGRFEAVKRPDRFLRLFERLPYKIQDRPVYGWMIGDGPLRAQLQRAAEETGLARRIHFAGARDDAVELLGALDLLVLPSDHEGHPMVLLEAMRAGVPLVASRVGGLQELGDLPWLTPAGNDTALVEAVQRLLSNDELRQSWADDLRRRFDQEGSIVGSADQVLDLYREALK